MILICSMWKEELEASRFPFAVNSENDAENILFMNSPERLVLLKWIYTLTNGVLKEISPKELANYFLNLGIVESDSYKFVEGNCMINNQKKVWSNLFQLAKMMKYSPEVGRNFSENYYDQMPSYCRVVADENMSSSTRTPDLLSFEPSIPNFDVISTLEEIVTKPVVTSAGGNKIILHELEEYLKRLSLINSQVRSLGFSRAKDQKQFGNSTDNFYKTMKTLETVLISSSMVMSSMRELEKNLDDHLLESHNVLQLVSKLKRFNGDF